MQEGQISYEKIYTVWSCLASIKISKTFTLLLSPNFKTMSSFIRGLQTSRVCRIHYPNIQKQIFTLS